MRIAIPIFDDFTALDAVGPYEVLGRLPGAEVVFVAEEARPYRTDTGALGLTADRTLAEIDQCDVLVVPGGPGAQAVLEGGALLEWVRQVDQGTRYTTSVCTGSLILGAAGLLDGREATTHWIAYEQLASFGARVTQERVVQQGKFITAAGVSSGIDMALTLAAHLAGDDVARAIQLGIEYDPQPPFDAGSPAKAGADIEALVRSVMASRAPTS